MTPAVQGGLLRPARRRAADARFTGRLRALEFWVIWCAFSLCVAGGGLLAQQQQQQPVPELDRVTLKSGKALAGLITKEEADRLVLKMKLGRGFISFTLLRTEVVHIRRASEAGRALTEAEWRKLEAALARRTRSARRSPPEATRPKPPQPQGRQPTTPKDPRDILLAEARRLGLSVRPDISTEKLQLMVEAEQTRRHDEAVKLFGQALTAFSEASAELPTLAYYHRSGRSAKLVYRRAPLTQTLVYYRAAYKLLGRAAELDPTLKLKAEHYRSNVRLAVRRLQFLVREADMVEEEGGSRKTNPDRQ